MEGRELRPLGVGEILDRAINIYFRNFGLLAKIAAVVIVPVTLVLFVLNLLSLNEVEAFSEGAALYEVGDTTRVLDQGTFVALSILGAIISVLGYLLVTGASFRAVSELHLGREPQAGASLRFTARRLHSLLWLSFLFALGVGLGFIALVIPGIWLLFAWSVCVPALLLEDRRGSKALGRSFDLVRQNWWRVFGALLVGLIFIGLFEFLGSLAAEGLGGLAEDSVPLFVAIVNLVNGLLTIITAPLQAAIITVIYYDLRVRKEAFDVEHLAANLESPGSASTPPPSPATSPPPPPPAPAPGA